MSCPLPGEPGGGQLIFVVQSGGSDCQPVRNDAIMTVKTGQDTVEIGLVQEKNGDGYGDRFNEAVCDAAAL